MNEVPLNLLVVDDEALARRRLLDLLDDLRAHYVFGRIDEAASGMAAIKLLSEQTLESRVAPCHAVLADIRMPGMDGLEMASHLSRLSQPPLVAFVTAYDHYAVRAFELNAIDYLLKPIRAERLFNALQKIRERVDLRLVPADMDAIHKIGQAWRNGGRARLACNEHGRLLLVPVAEILYFRAEQKYVEACTASACHLLEESLSHLETEYAPDFVRLHRSVLAARHAITAFERTGEGDPSRGEKTEEPAYGWAWIAKASIRLPVSRRQWITARQTTLK